MNATHPNATTAPPTIAQAARNAAGAVYRAALEAYRSISDAELGGVINALRHDLAACAGCAECDAINREVCRLLIQDRLDAAFEVERRRLARWQAGAGPNPRMRDQVAWADLAETVNRDADLVAILESAGFAVVRQGREVGTACPACGEGEDRFRVFPEPDRRAPVPRGWCRRCGWTADAVRLVRTLFRLSFFDAVSVLATDQGLPVPPRGLGERDGAAVAGRRVVRL
jgi:hypothetical protein